MSTQNPHDDDAPLPERARSFGAAAAGYAAVRPTYPAEALDFLLDGLAGGFGERRLRAADVGAGAGALTVRLVERGLEVVAVDPDPQMLAQLHVDVPGVPTFVGTAEHLPLPDAAVDLVVLGQAWHWVDPAPASAEVGRALAPGGRLGLLWNRRDETVPWVAALGDLLAPAPHMAARAADPQIGAPLVDAEQHTTGRWTHELSPEDVVGLAASRSYVLTAAPEERQRVLDGVRDLLATHPETAGLERIPVPYTTTCWRARRP
ncbi:class I SAM-dependent methyltransferase [Quadrisphaera setariae]|uniref:Class I SAM-dependent methyltransferase n=1 Tax=Quadrisphaera setariae TaxID=2593304 RepID=A0A5C8ZIM9_9ACTN|nr:class I SAM-dependent methyltransferase [Quadrisphaera setariae]TXR57727.1 class I SAM-dependent methyltransferase [Quadrisphaera setariae]